jgi:hypothetical protein
MRNEQCRSIFTVLLLDLGCAKETAADLTRRNNETIAKLDTETYYWRILELLLLEDLLKPEVIRDLVLGSFRDLNNDSFNVTQGGRNHLDPYFVVRFSLLLEESKEALQLIEVCERGGDGEGEENSAGKWEGRVSGHRSR